MRSFLIILALNLGLVVLDRVLVAPPSHETHSDSAFPLVKSTDDMLEYGSTVRWQNTVLLVDASIIKTDASLSNTFWLRLTENDHTLGNPTNLMNGAIYTWFITQAGTAGNTLNYGSAFRWRGDKAPKLSTFGYSIDTIRCACDGKLLWCAFAAAAEK